MHTESVRQPAFAGGLLSQPFRLDCSNVHIPRALPWAIMFQPFRLKSN
jgi:hypothetical protein